VTDEKHLILYLDYFFIRFNKIDKVLAKVIKIKYYCRKTNILMHFSEFSKKNVTNKSVVSIFFYP
jgi:hypothetical protein